MLKRSPPSLQAFHDPESAVVRRGPRNRAEEFKAINRDDVIRHIHRLAHAVACGQSPFPQSEETTQAVYRMLAETGLSKEIGPNLQTLTEPGLGDLLILAGIHEPWDIVGAFAWDVSDEDLKRLEFAPTEAETLEVLRELAVKIYAKYLPFAPLAH
jgi:hypothetical protein